MGEYFADILVNDLVIVEIKAVETLGEKHEAQLLNYLRSTNMEVGLLLNFGPKPQIKRKIFEVRYKELDTELRYTDEADEHGSNKKRMKDRVLDSQLISDPCPCV